MRYDCDLNPAKPPMKRSKPVLCHYAHEVFERMTRETLHGFLFDEKTRDEAISLFRPARMPDTPPTETADYRRWKAWSQFVSECHQRAAVAGRRAGEHFKTTGVTAPSREGMLATVWFEINQQIQ